MEASYSTTSAQSAASFFYYTPDPQAKPRHHGHFLPHPQSLAAQTPQLLAPTPISPMSFPSQLVYGGEISNRSLAPTLCITPAASPSLMKSRGSLSAETSNLSIDTTSPELLFNPATPPLSHSAMSTPAMTHAMLTPMSNHGFSSEEPTCGTIAPFEMQLPGTPVDWNAGSPDYSPLYVFPGLSLPSNASPPPSIVINDYCPALSPSTSQTSSTPDLDFCDPRNLTFPSPAPAESEFGLNFPVLPTLVGDDEDHSLLLGSDLVSIKTDEKSFNAYSFDFIDDLSDFESEDDFISGFAKISEESMSSPSKRQCLEESSDDEHCHPHTSCTTPCSTEKKFDSDSEEEKTEEQNIRSFKFGHSMGTSAPRSSSKPNGIPINPNVIRRGRKQSLTEDPSKTFVCHLCNRRFRRQEHLKRHFRSLHTEDKPFSCGECGKKFSRSDNLTQHARIHGSGAILLGVLDENEVMDGRQQFMPSTEPQPLGIVVVDALQAAAGSNKENASNEEKRNRRKRRRNDE